MTSGTSATGRHGGLAAVLAVMVYLALEGASFAGLHLLRMTRGIEYDPISTTTLRTEHRETLDSLVAGRAVYLTYSPVLGWTIKPNGVFRDLYRANSMGLRSDQEHDLAPPPGRVRIAGFGDSFTHGDEVRNADTWIARLQEADSTLEVMNFGVQAYGLDQAFLRYQADGARYQPDIVFIGFMSENIFRHVNVWRPFYVTGANVPLAKPRFGLEQGELVLWETPVRDLSGYRELLADPAGMLPSFGRNDYHYRTRPWESPLDIFPSVRLLRLAGSHLLLSDSAIVIDDHYNPASEAFKVTTGIFDRFVAEVERNGSLPVIVVFPDFYDIRRLRERNIVRYRPLLQFFDQRGYRYIEILPAFEPPGGGPPVSDLVPAHYSPMANRLVAAHILDYLRSHRLSDPGAFRRRP